ACPEPFQTVETDATAARYARSVTPLRCRIGTQNGTDLGEPQVCFGVRGVPSDGELQISSALVEPQLGDRSLCPGDPARWCRDDAGSRYDAHDNDASDRGTE